MGKSNEILKLCKKKKDPRIFRRIFMTSFVGVLPLMLFGFTDIANIQVTITQDKRLDSGISTGR